MEAIKHQRKFLITTTGCFNTGSSAITHLLSEMDGVCCKTGTYELRLLYDPDCISDLECHLIENPHRQNTSNAIVRFKKFIDFNSNRLTNYHYEQMCDGHFREISYDYIRAISEFCYRACSHIDIYNKGFFPWVLNRVYQKIIFSLYDRIPPRFLPFSVIGNQKLYAGTFDRSKFLEATRHYMGQILSYMNPSDKDTIIIDQLLPPTNIERYARYLPSDYELKTFVVERDPRDLYVTCKYLIKTNIIPCQSPDVFCQWFLWTRRQCQLQPDSDAWMRVRFEDLIYDYENTRQKIIRFCGLEGRACSKKGQIFNPYLSLNNTQVWYRYPKSLKEVEYIQEHLKDYCYNFDIYDLKPDFKEGKMFDC